MADSLIFFALSTILSLFSTPEHHAFLESTLCLSTEEKSERLQKAINALKKNSLHNFEEAFKLTLFQNLRLQRSGIPDIQARSFIRKEIVNATYTLTYPYSTYTGTLFGAACHYKKIDFIKLLASWPEVDTHKLCSNYHPLVLLFGGPAHEHSDIFEQQLLPLVKRLLTNTTITPNDEFTYSSDITGSGIENTCIRFPLIAVAIYSARLVWIQELLNYPIDWYKKFMFNNYSTMGTIVDYAEYRYQFCTYNKIIALHENPKIRERRKTIVLLLKEAQSAYEKKLLEDAQKLV